jgi:glutamate 5-kinase
MDGMDAPNNNVDDPRRALASAKRIVVKIGSRAIMGGQSDGSSGADNTGRFQMMADQAAELIRRGHSVVIVSSGAVGLGLKRMGLPGRPKSLPMVQAAAAIGQSRLMQAYEVAFAKHGIPVAQVLLTHNGIKDRERYLNVQRAMDALFELGVVPIINENDAVSTEELKFGDNDQLAAMVAPLVSADLLVLLTDVEGLLDDNKVRIPIVHEPAQVRQFIWQHSSNVSLGGMLSKVGAAERALRGGIPVVIGPASDPQVLARVMDGDDIGTLFLPAGMKLASRKHWIAFALKMRGVIIVDDGAARALVEKKKSLLPAGIKDVRGTFVAGDAVSIESLDGRELARGLVRYATADVRTLIGARSDQIEERVGHFVGEEIVHRDDLVVL